MGNLLVLLAFFFQTLINNFIDGANGVKIPNNVKPSQKNKKKKKKNKKISEKPTEKKFVKRLQKDAPIKDRAKKEKKIQ